MIVAVVPTLVPARVNLFTLTDNFEVASTTHEHMPFPIPGNKHPPRFWVRPSMMQDEMSAIIKRQYTHNLISVEDLHSSGDMALSSDLLAQG